MNLLFVKRMLFASLILGLFLMAVSGDRIGGFIVGLGLFLIGLMGMVTSFFFTNAESADEFIGGLTGQR